MTNRAPLQNTGEYPSGAVAVVTGGAGGLGSACAELLTSRGVTVVTADVSDAADFVCDITDEHSVRQLRLEVEQSVGSANILVNAAGVQGPESSVVETEYSAWQHTFRVNLDGAFLMSKHFAPAMVDQRWGRIVNLASIAGKEGNANQAAYSASKAGMIGLTKSLAKELALDGVLVNAVAPALISTELNKQMRPETYEDVLKRIPLGRAGTPKEVAELVAWLTSNRCSFSTGSVYDLSGGRATY